MTLCPIVKCKEVVKGFVWLKKMLSLIKIIPDQPSLAGKPNSKFTQHLQLNTTT